jgi:hypothetical protein
MIICLINTVLFLQCILVDALTTKSYPTLAFVRPPGDYDTDSVKFIDKKKGFKNIRSRRKLFFCQDEEFCAKIEEFSVTNSSMKCNDKFLSIDITYKIDKQNAVSTEAYMHSFTSELLHKQESEENCRIMKRFYFDEEMVIIIINHVLSVVPLEFENEYIKKRLYDQKYYWDYIFFF